MTKIREIQIESLEVLGRQVANIQLELDKHQDLTNDFAIEAKLYFLKELGKRFENMAAIFYEKCRQENTVPTEKSTRDVFKYIFGENS